MMKFSFGDTVDMIVAVVAAYSEIPEHPVELINAYSNTITALKYQESYSEAEILSTIGIFMKLIFNDISTAVYARLSGAYENLHYSEVRND